MKTKKKRGGGGFNTVTSCISTTMVLILLGIVVFFVTMADNLGRSLRENFTVEVLLDDSISAHELKKLEDDLRHQPYVRTVSYTSKAEATREQAEALDADPMEFLGYSPIPASFELSLNADYANKDSLDRYTPALKERKYVTDVIYPQDLMQSVNANIQRISLVLLVVAALLAIVSFSLINNTIRLNVYSRRFTIQSMKLVGARWGYIRRPFMAQAFWIGLVASILASSLLFGGIYSMEQWDSDISTLVSPLVWVSTIGSVFVCGIFLTMLCAYFSVNHHLRMTQNEAFRR